MKEKKLYRGVFSYRCGLIRKFTHAHSAKQAKVFMVRQIAKDHEVSYGIVSALFDGHKDNFFIEEEKG
jgi:hypothetical protein